MLCGRLILEAKAGYPSLIMDGLVLMCCERRGKVASSRVKLNAVQRSPLKFTEYFMVEFSLRHGKQIEPLSSSTLRIEDQLSLLDRGLWGPDFWL